MKVVFIIVCVLGILIMLGVVGFIIVTSVRWCIDKFFNAEENDTRGYWRKEE